jgi:threonine/homoserine/homoserine lactone efflux protein
MIAEFLSGAWIGLLVAVPIGPTCMICIRKMLFEGRPSGYAACSGAAFANFLYSTIAISAFALIASHQPTDGSLLMFFIRLLGAVLIGYLGIQVLLSGVPELKKGDTNISALKSFGLTLGLSLANPLTVFTFLGLVSKFNLGNTPTHDAIMLILGVTLSSLAWYISLAEATHLIRRWGTEKAFYYINKLSGIALIYFSASMFYLTFQKALGCLFIS